MAVMGMRAAVAGASGYAGGELLRLLAGHPEIDVAVATAGSSAGADITAVHPHLPVYAGRTFAATEPAALADADVVFLALPHGESAALADQLPGDVLVVDLGADFRLEDAGAWERFYGSTHAGTWTYGLPELPGQRELIASAKRIANPGCYVTAISLGLAPVISAGLVEPDDLVVVAASGTSGAGRVPKPNLVGSEVMGSMSSYKVGGVHQHTPEIEQNLAKAAGRPVSLSFIPLLAPMPRGILATCTAKVARGVTHVDLRAALCAAYDPEPFVHVLPDGSFPATAATLGSNAVHLQVALDEAVGRAIVVVAEDNLVKGAAGQAVQNANLALGLPETTGLTALGVAP
jgi:N-acetyl-gamma-glutamyl-phosphate reductase